MSEGNAHHAQGDIDKKALLGDLKIDRTAEQESGGTWWKVLLFALLLVVVGAGLWFVDIAPNGGGIVPVKSAVARSQSGQAVGSSVLDATGYVVARRQATVSSARRPARWWRC